MKHKEAKIKVAAQLKACSNDEKLPGSLLSHNHESY
jgi:hypothetical protein